MTEKNKNKPDLHFSPSGTTHGFTSAGVQGFNDLNPMAIVRELVQNSLDAVREDGRTKAIIRFELEKIALADVPAIDSYRDAVKSAVKDQTKLHNGELSDQAEMVVNAIQAHLAEDTVEALAILDNGLGLDKERMTGLLADGVSMKSSAGAGAVGNGHLTAIPASDLRYVLYGGVSNDGQLASGHAILASFHNSQGKSVGKDGYYVLAVNNSLNNPYDFVPCDDIAPLIKKKLDWIETNFRSKRGAAVIIPGFNGFREKSDLWNTIKKAAACSFFTAIADDHLEVVYVDANGEKTLDKSNIGDVFNSDLASEKRAKKFLSGSKASEAYKTMTDGQAHQVDVGCGKAEVIIREINGGKSGLGLCRNGMWITDRLPCLSLNKFSDRKPFHCLIKVTAQDGEIHRLIRKSEPPLHNHIYAKKCLKGNELRQLNGAFDAISKFLLDNLEELQAEEFQVNNYLTVMGDEVTLSGGRRAGRIGKFEEIPPRRVRSPSRGRGNGDGGGTGRSGGDGPTVNAFKRSGNSVLFGAIPVPTGTRSCNVELLPQEELNSDNEAEIRFVLDESIDETCDLTNDEQFVRLYAVELNNKKVPDDRLIKSKDAVLGVRLGQFKKDEKYILSFNYELPDGVDVRAKDKVVLRAEIVRRRATV